MKEIETTDACTVFSGVKAVNIFRAQVMASALRLYARTKMQVNRAYSPKNMMKAASQILGKEFPPRAYEQAAEELRLWVEREYIQALHRRAK